MKIMECEYMKKHGSVYFSCGDFSKDFPALKKTYLKCPLFSGNLQECCCHKDDPEWEISFKDKIYLLWLNLTRKI